KGEEEPLLGREPVDALGLRLAGDRFLPRGVGHHEPPEIRDALSEHELAVLMDPLLDLEAVELLADALGALLELLLVGLRPPLLEVPACIELSSLVVEPMGHLMTDDRAHRAVVRGVVRTRV